MTLWYSVDHGTETKRIEFDIVRMRVPDVAIDIARRLQLGLHTITIWEDEERKRYLIEYDIRTFTDAAIVWTAQAK